MKKAPNTCNPFSLTHHHHYNNCAKPSKLCTDRDKYQNTVWTDFFGKPEMHQPPHLSTRSKGKLSCLKLVCAAENFEDRCYTVIQYAGI